MVRTHVLTPSQANIPQRWVYLFAIWLALIVPLLALGVAFYKGSQPVAKFKAAQEQSTAVQNLQWTAAQDSSYFVRLVEQDAALRTAAVGGTPAAEWNVMAFAPQNARLIVITAGKHLLLTRDGGKSWLQMPNVLPGRADAVAISPDAEAVMYAHINGKGYYLSADGGASWQAYQR